MDFYLYSLALIRCLSDNHAFSPFSGTQPWLAPMPCDSPWNGFPLAPPVCAHCWGCRPWGSSLGEPEWMVLSPAASPSPAQAQVGLCWVLFHPTTPWNSLSKALPRLGMFSRTAGFSSECTQQFLTLRVSHRKKTNLQGLGMSPSP